MKKINNHIIVGYGKWGQIIFDEIKNLNFFNNIYIKSNSKITYIKINSCI